MQGESGLNKGILQLPEHLYFKDVMGILPEENLKKEKFYSFSERGEENEAS